MAELATKATDQAEESEAKVKALRTEKEEMLKTFSEEKHELLAKLKQLQEIITDKDQELKVSKWRSFISYVQIRVINSCYT